VLEGFLKLGEQMNSQMDGWMDERMNRIVEECICTPFSPNSLLRYFDIGVPTRLTPLEHLVLSTV
jgi:hypothetical protein